MSTRVRQRCLASAKHIRLAPNGLTRAGAAQVASRPLTLVDPER